MYWFTGMEVSAEEEAFMAAASTAAGTADRHRPQRHSPTATSSLRRQKYRASAQAIAYW